MLFLLLNSILQPRLYHLLTLQMSGFVLRNSTIKHVSQQKSLVVFYNSGFRLLWTDDTSCDSSCHRFRYYLSVAARRLPACGAAVVSASTCADVELCGRMCGLQSHPAVIR